MNFYLIVGIAALGGLLFGYDTGVISGALLFIRTDFALSAGMQGLVAGIALAGAAVGAAFAGGLSDRFGRRMVIFFTGLIFIVGSLVAALAPEVSLCLSGRLLVGVGIGVASMLTPLYLAETAPARSRGALVSLNQLAITVGILVSYLVGYLFARHRRMALDAGAGRGAGGDPLRRHADLAGNAALARRPWTHGGSRRRCCGGCAGRATSRPSSASCAPISCARAGCPSWRELLSPAVRLPLIIGVGPGDLSADHRHQHGDLFRADHLSGRRPLLGLGRHIGDRRRRGRQCRHDPGRDPADRQRRPAHPAA